MEKEGLRDKGAGGLMASPLFMVAILLLLGCLTRFIGIDDHPPRTDELYHIVAGRSWAKDGSFAFIAGVYERSWLYTVATGTMFKLFGVGMAEGRALSAIGGVLEIVAVGLWVRRIAGAPAGWIAGLLLCFNYLAIEQAQTARFYTWHALLVWLFAIASHALVTDIGKASSVGGLSLPKGERALVKYTGLLLIALGSLALANHLQKMTPIVVAAVGTWALLWLLIHGAFDPLLRSRARLAGTAVVIAVVAGTILAIFWPSLHEEWLYYRRAPAWAVEDSASESYYVQQLGYALNWMFSLFPVAAMIAWRKYRDAALFCAVILAVALLAHSLGGMKAMRYVHYLFPFFCALWGLAFAAALPSIIGFVRGLVPGWNMAARAALAGGVLGFAALLALTSANSYRDTLVAAVKFVKTGSPDIAYTGRWAREDVDWTPYLPRLRALAKRSVFVATDLQRTAYFLGDYDIMLNKSEVDDIGDEEFVWDHRTGRPDISKPESLALLMRCYPSGSLLVSESKIGSADIPDDTFRFIEREMKRVPLPAKLDMRAYEWRGTPDRAAPACKALYDAGYVRAGREKLDG